jgi:hypothetical protein
MSSILEWHDILGHIKVEKLKEFFKNYKLNVSIEIN